MQWEVTVKKVERKTVTEMGYKKLDGETETLSDGTKSDKWGSVPCAIDKEVAEQVLQIRLPHEHMDLRHLTAFLAGRTGCSCDSFPDGLA